MRCNYQPAKYFGKLVSGFLMLDSHKNLCQVLKKADMIRKNAVESILAERDILISVRNPFVVSYHGDQ